MPEPEDLSETILDAAKNPQSVSVDGQTVNERSLTELIEAQRFLDRKKSAAKSPFGRLFKVNRPGPV